MLLNVTPEQSNTILSLVSIAENSTTNWQANYNYIEDIKDGRGYTINIVGFCTGTGDFLWLAKNLQSFNPTHPLCKYIPPLIHVNGSSSHKGLDGLPELIKSLGSDADYIQATWNAINHFYWKPVLKLAAKLKLVNAVTLGQLYDMNLNAGDLQSATKAKFTTEEAWLKQVQKNWLKRITKQDSSLDERQPDRALMWMGIASNKDLALPINVECYGEKYTIQ